MRLSEEIVRLGYFWLPSNSEKKIPGTLKITDGGEITLEVVSNFDGGFASHIETNVKLPRIVGHVEEDGYITLDDCFYGSQDTSSKSGITKSLVHVTRVLCGVHFDEKENLIFNTFQFSVEGLDEWLSITGIKVKNDRPNKTASINYIPPEEEVFSLSNGMQLKFTFSWTLPGSPIVTEAKIKQKAYIKLISEHPKPLSDFISTAHKVTSLLCFAIDETVSIRDVSATLEGQQEKLPRGNTRPVEIRIYYPSLPFSNEIPKAVWFYMLFRFPQIKDNVSEIFNKWLDAYEVIEPSINLYFAAKTGAHKYLEGQFLSLVQGLETYHRRTSRDTLMDEKEYETLQTDILKKCPEGKRDWLAGRLKHGNEISLRNRLKRVIEPFKEHIGNSREREKIIGNIVDTRNYFTHYDNDSTISNENLQEVWTLCMKMEAIFQLHFLKVLRFTDEQINFTVKNSRNLRHKLGKQD